jgi:quercetin dioxygenase-like cupin family protein
MTEKYHFFQNLIEEIPVVHADSIISHTVRDDEQVKVVLFGFAPGQALSEHTASMPAIIHILDGKAHLILDGDPQEAQSDTWVYMPANCAHSVIAETPLTMVLYMLKGGKV